MRVVHVVCDLSGGGAERLVLDLCKHAPAGTHAEVIAVQSGGDLGPAFAAAGIQVRCAARPRKALGLRALWRMGRWMRGADVVHTHLWAGDMWGRAAACLARVPLVSTEHNIDRAEPPWKQRVKIATSGANHSIVAVSDAVADYWISRGLDPDVISVIDNGVDLTRFSTPYVGGSGADLLAVGRLVPQKGFDLLIEAVADLDCTLDIAGDGPEKQRLMSLAGEHVRFLGAVEDIPERLAAADILVVPSRWEGFGMVALEGMAAGVPVIASATGGLGPLVGDAGSLVPPNDVKSLQRAIEDLLADPLEQRALSAKGRRRAGEFSLYRMATSYARLYEAITRL